VVVVSISWMLPVEKRTPRRVYQIGPRILGAFAKNPVST
jgi:hypothetical protein